MADRRGHEAVEGEMIAAGAILPWVAQISANLLADEELVDLIADAGGKWIFIGMESIDPANMASPTTATSGAAPPKPRIT